MLIVLASLSASAGPVCEQPSTLSQVASHISDANLAWATMDEDGFGESVEKAERAVDCLDELLPAGQAAGLHRVVGLRAFLEGNTDGATSSFTAAANAAPGYELSEKLAPKGGKLWRLYVAAAEGLDDDAQALDVPKGVKVWVDGRATRQRAVGLPAVVQGGDSSESITFSEYLDANQAFVPPAAPMVNLDAPEPRKPKKLDPLWIAAGGAGVATAGLFGGSAAARSSFMRRPNRSTYNTTNGAYIASTGMAVVTGGLITAAIVRAKKRR